MPIGIDIIGDIAYVLNRTSEHHIERLSGDVDASGNRVNAIKKWAKYKPVRWNNREVPSDSYRRAMLWGLSFNSGVNRNANSQNPYWVYNPPRGNSHNEPHRVLDFDRYFHGAECPMLQTNMSLDNSGQIHLDLSTIANLSQNVEIPLTDAFAGQDYVGFVLWDTTRKFGYYCVTDVRVDDLCDGIDPTSTSWHNFNKEIVSLAFSNGDTVEFFWCNNYQTTIVHDQGGDYPEIFELTSGAANTIELMACDATHGHTTFLIQKLDIYTHLAFSKQSTIISGSWSQSQTDWTLGALTTTLQCDYSWPRSASGESYQMTWRLRDNDGDIFTKTQYLSAANASQYYTLLLQGGGRTYSADYLRDNNYIISVDLYGKLTGSPDERFFATIEYDVRNGIIL